MMCGNTCSSDSIGRGHEATLSWFKHVCVWVSVSTVVCLREENPHVFSTYRKSCRENGCSDYRILASLCNSGAHIHCKERIDEKAREGKSGNYTISSTFSILLSLLSKSLYFLILLLSSIPLSLFSNNASRFSEPCDFFSSI